MRNTGIHESGLLLIFLLAVAEGHGDTAVVLLKAGAETDKRDTNGLRAIDLSPDARVRDFIVRAAEEEGIDLT